MQDWLPYWYAGLLGTSSARAFVEAFATRNEELDAQVKGELVALDRDQWPESWRTRFESSVELRDFVTERSEQAEQALQRMKSTPRTSMVSTQFAFARPAFRTPFVQHLGTLRATLQGVPRVAIVGTRKIAHEDAKRIRGWLSSWFRAAPVIVVSGGAYGIDSIAHEAALDVGLSTWSVQAGGLATLSPSGNSPLFRRIVESGGAMISERPPHIAPRKHDFLARNRIIAALADAVIVVRAPHRSGALNTAREATRMGIPVYVVPGSPGEASVDGSNGLLNANATVLGNASDWEDMVRNCQTAKSSMLELDFSATSSASGRIATVAMDRTRAVSVRNPRRSQSAEDGSGASSRAATTSTLKPSTPAERVLCELLADGTHHFDAISRKWELELHGPLSSVLLHAELRGAVARLPGNQYRWC